MVVDVSQTTRGRCCPVGRFRGRIFPMLRKSTRAFRRTSRKYFNWFLSATKLRRREDVEEALRKQYRLFLHREANPAELRMWFSHIFDQGKALRAVLKTIARSPEAKKENLSYQQWVSLYDTLDDQDRRQIIEHIQSLTYQPSISIVMPTYNTPEVFLREAVTSIRQQSYEN